jgi:probable HAF family extracellular repeat protein
LTFVPTRLGNGISSFGDAEGLNVRFDKSAGVLSVLILSRVLRGALFCIVAAVPVSALGAPAVYNAVRIGALGGSGSFGVAINTAGDVAGWSWTNAATLPHAWRASGTQTTDLGRFGGLGAYAYGINDFGDIVGQVNTAGTTHHAFVLSGGTFSDLHPAGATSSTALGINNFGQVAGDYVDAGGVRHPVIYSGGIGELGSLGGNAGQAWSINNTGQTTGYSNDSGGNQRAFRHAGAAMINLGTLLNGSVSHGLGINARGDVVGYSTTAGPNGTRAFIHTNGQMLDLGTLGGATSTAQSINDAGQIVGQAATASGDLSAFLYTEAAMFDLNALVISGLNGARLTHGVAVNKKGQIVAQACPSATTCQTFRLDPTAPAGKVRAVEYYHAAFDHYFLTTIDEEITKLDDGTFAGWTRTGSGIDMDIGVPAGTVPVCRFFSASFAPKSSHFYTPVADECTTVKQNPVWTLEGEVFSVTLPAANGGCPAGRVPVYRLYNDGQGGAPNHRYTTNLTIRATMIDRGWVPEGLGALGVIMCA